MDVEIRNRSRCAGKGDDVGLFVAQHHGECTLRQLDIRVWDIPQGNYANSIENALMDLYDTLCPNGLNKRYSPRYSSRTLNKRYNARVQKDDWDAVALLETPSVIPQRLQRELAARAATRKAIAKRAAHVARHVHRGVVNPDCELCQKALQLWRSDQAHSFFETLRQRLKEAA